MQHTLQQMIPHTKSDYCSEFMEIIRIKSSTGIETQTYNLSMSNIGRISGITIRSDDHSLLDVKLILSTDLYSDYLTVFFLHVQSFSIIKL